jgi:hypothetical protein
MTSNNDETLVGEKYSLTENKWLPLLIEPVSGLSSAGAQALLQDLGNNNLRGLTTLVFD